MFYIILPHVRKGDTQGDAEEVKVKLSLLPD